MKKVWISTTLFFLVIFGAWYLVIHLGQEFIERHRQAEKTLTPIAPGKNHPQYWSMNGEDIMLLGGSVEDNLFQIDGVEEHLDLLQSAGGNYVRNTMSSRDDGNLWPFAQNEDGLYDLNRWNEAYWSRFDHFLKACSIRDIVVQIELWATFDFYGEPWAVNPFNPKNNVNYTSDRVHLRSEINSHPVMTENDFFRSVPSQHCNLKLLEYQQLFMDKLLSYSLAYGNVLYCIDNETSVTAEWATFWARYIKAVAIEHNKEIYVTEMWDPWNLDHIIHRETTDHPELYDFVDISQNNHNTGDVHWNNGLSMIKRLTSRGMLRPVNNVKVYGNDGGKHQTTQNSIDAYVRNVLLGAASSRFHRPPTGQGLNLTAQRIISSMRMVSGKDGFYDAVPHNQLLEMREADEAYCRAVAGKMYLVYFPQGGEVSLQVLRAPAGLQVEWLDIKKAAWDVANNVKVENKKVVLKTPTSDSWLAYIKIN
ncbi:MAG: hypothetical protein HC819_22615 [Cyclobacteriaceae bacterium]|nr:hypothetical protein [Cyclobacteriaceae bacterium]